MFKVGDKVKRKSIYMRYSFVDKPYVTVSNIYLAGPGCDFDYIVEFKEVPGEWNAERFDKISTGKSHLPSWW